MTDIQKARDVLAKWRKDAAKSNYAWMTTTGTRGLVLGTAGNPDLLDEVYRLLDYCVTHYDVSLTPFAKRIAAAIIAADERMSA